MTTTRNPAAPADTLPAGAAPHGRQRPDAGGSGDRRSDPGTASGRDGRGATQRGRVDDPARQSYYGRSILKPPVWRWYIPAYFFTGGLAGASAGLALAAELGGRWSLASRASVVGLVALAASPPLLIADLGRPARFYNMLRVVKVTSPMSIGTWVLTGAGAAMGAAAAAEVLRLPRPARLAARAAAGLLGAPLATYTGALVADTAVPAWHEARIELPFVFGAGAAASAGGLAAAVTRPSEAGPARWLAVGGALAEVGASVVMERRLGRLLAEPYRTGRSGRLSRLAAGCSLGGAAVLLGAGHRRSGAVVGGLLAAAGSLVQRFAVGEAGQVSAADPRYVVEPQRAALAARSSRPGSAAGQTTTAAGAGSAPVIPAAATPLATPLVGEVGVEPTRPSRGTGS